MKENSIKEDIKILENFINWLKIDFEYDSGEEIKAIEHILSDYKRVLKENNRLEEQVEYDKTHIYTPQTIELNFISKSKIEDKIEELKKNLHTVEHYETVGAIHVLQELLEENENHIPRIN